MSSANSAPEVKPDEVTSVPEPVKVDSVAKEEPSKNPKSAKKPGTPKKSPKGGKKGTPKKTTTPKGTKSKQVKKELKKAKQTKLTRRKKTEERKRARIRNGILRREKLAARRAKSHSKFQIRCRKPVEDEIFDVDEFVKFLTEKFKINGKTGLIGTSKDASIQKAGSAVHVISKQPFPKYYIK
ncbi:Ribosomal Protein, Large subunit family member (rpl-22), partial [Reticulomyxa filosa]